MRIALVLLLIAPLARADGEWPARRRRQRPAAPAATAPAPDAASARASGAAQPRAPAAAPPHPSAAAQPRASAPAEALEPAPAATDPRMGSPAACLPTAFPDRSCLVAHPLCDNCREVARTAWQYFRHNTQPTGLVNAVDGYPSTTIWDAGSSLAAIVSAGELDIISPKERDDRLASLLAALQAQKLYNDQLPNKAYSSATDEMTDYAGKPSSKGIGYSALDIARLLSWLDLTACLLPSHQQAIEHVVARWDLCPMIKEGQLYGMNESGVSLQEGRLGYEQYAGRALEQVGFSLPVAARYHNAHAATVQIEGVPILYDDRDPKEFGAINYVATESYALDAIENGLSEESAPLLRNVFEAQRRRYQRTGLVTAVTEDHIDRSPWFVYNTLFASGETWKALTDSGQDMGPLRTISVKAALSLATLFPDDPYSAVVADAVKSAWDPERGWYAGVYESGMGYNRALTANTNGILLELMLYKVYGPLRAACGACKTGLHLPPRWLTSAEARAHCLPAQK